MLLCLAPSYLHLTEFENACRFGAQKASKIRLFEQPIPSNVCSFPKRVVQAVAKKFNFAKPKALEKTGSAVVFSKTTGSKPAAKGRKGPIQNKSAPKKTKPSEKQAGQPMSKRQRLDKPPPPVNHTAFEKLKSEQKALQFKYNVLETENNQLKADIAEKIDLHSELTEKYNQLNKDYWGLTPELYKKFHQERQDTTDAHNREKWKIINKKDAEIADLCKQFDQQKQLLREGAKRILDTKLEKERQKYDAEISALRQELRTKLSQNSRAVDSNSSDITQYKRQAANIKELLREDKLDQNLSRQLTPTADTTHDASRLSSSDEDSFNTDLEPISSQPQQESRLLSGNDASDMCSPALLRQGSRSKSRSQDPLPVNLSSTFLHTTTSSLDTTPALPALQSDVSLSNSDNSLSMNKTPMLPNCSTIESGSGSRSTPLDDSLESVTRSYEFVPRHKVNKLPLDQLRIFEKGPEPRSTRPTRTAKIASTDKNGANTERVLRSRRVLKNKNINYPN